MKKKGAVFLVTFFTAYIGLMYYFFNYRPNHQVIDSGYKYRNLQRWMESEDAKHYYPTLNKAMEDGLIYEYEFRQLQRIEEQIELSREKTSFLDFWKTNKTRWDEGDFSNKA